MDTDLLAIAVEVARRGSFAAVARDRGLDASSVSRAVATLEAQLGIRLFQRSTRRLNPTEAGERYLTAVEPLIDELAHLGEAVRSTGQRLSGTLRLTASVSFGQGVILPLLPAFRRAHPELGLECLFTDASLDLIADRIDLAVRLAPTISGDLIVSRLANTRYRVLASPDYLRQAPVLRRPEDLTAHDCIAFALRPFRTAWRFRDQVGREVEVPVQADLVMSPASAIRDACCAGLGPALLPDWLIKTDIAQGRLVDVFPAYRVTATSFDTASWLVYPSRRHLPAKTRAMIDFLRAHLA